MCASFPLGFEGRNWNLIVLLPDYCPLFSLLDYFFFSGLSQLFFLPISRRLKFCRKEPFIPKQPTHKHTNRPYFSVHVPDFHFLDMPWQVSRCMHLETCQGISKRWKFGAATLLFSFLVPFVGQGPTALALGANWGCLGIFFFRLSFSLLSPSL